jgi:hypothetical protein
VYPPAISIASRLSRASAENSDAYAFIIVASWAQ